MGIQRLLHFFRFWNVGVSNDLVFWNENWFRKWFFWNFQRRDSSIIENSLKIREFPRICLFRKNKCLSTRFFQIVTFHFNVMKKLFLKNTQTIFFDVNVWNFASFICKDGCSYKDTDGAVMEEDVHSSCSRIEIECVVSKLLGPSGVSTYAWVIWIFLFQNFQSIWNLSINDLNLCEKNFEIIKISEYIE